MEGREFESDSERKFSDFGSKLKICRNLIQTYINPLRIAGCCLLCYDWDIGEENLDMRVRWNNSLETG